MSKIVELWAQGIEAGRKVLKDAPAALQAEVQKLLEANNLPEENVSIDENILPEVETT